MKKKLLTILTLFLIFRFANAQNVGIGTASPNAKLDIEGALRVGMSINAPQSGMIRWDPITEDFEGYNGMKWISLTKGNDKWGTSTNVENKKILASDAAANDFFGYSVSMSEDYAIVSAYLDDDNGSNSGSAYIFHKTSNTWTQQAKILASDAAANDIFGHSVSISGDYAIVGADGNGSSSGSAYIFHRSGTVWTQQAKILASDAAANDFFGGSVSISGDYAIVGADGNDDNGSSSGSAYIFFR